MLVRELNEQEAEMVSNKKELTEKPQLLVLDWTNKFFEIWKKYAQKFSSDKYFMLASVIVKNTEKWFDEKNIIWIWTNSSDFHEKFLCKRKDKNWKSLYKSGEKYEFCPWCNPKTTHSESLAIRNTFVQIFLEKFQNNKKVFKKYSKQIKKLKNWIFLNNFIAEINFEEFVEDFKKKLWKEIYDREYSKIKEKIKNSTIFLYWHFWACPTCWNYCKDYDIKNIIVQKNAFEKNLER